ncbi:MAG: type I-C CRISPR-associated protein Cas5 [Flavobacteriales bacterium]|nr:type I-C CRISPR-associated protein Cas5 [Flavobacteriales bacterium]
MRNSIEFKVWGRYALFTDPLTGIGGENCTYHIPTYEALKGVAKSIYWKPTIIWVVDAVRVMKPIRTQTKGAKPMNYNGIYPSYRDLSKKKEEPINTLSYYTYLADVEYKVHAHFVLNKHRPELKEDWNEGKHYNIAQRMLQRGGRQDIFLGTRECQGYVEPCTFDDEDDKGHYANSGEVGYGLTFHGFDYPDETGVDELHKRFWNPRMKDGLIEFPPPERFANPGHGERLLRQFVRPMKPKNFKVGDNMEGVATTETEWNKP